jgi:hypothetical protein
METIHPDRALDLAPIVDLDLTAAAATTMITAANRQGSSELAPFAMCRPSGTHLAINNVAGDYRPRLQFVASLKGLSALILLRDSGRRLTMILLTFCIYLLL